MIWVYGTYSVWIWMGLNLVTAACCLALPMGLADKLGNRTSLRGDAVDFFYAFSVGHLAMVGFITVLFDSAEFWYLLIALSAWKTTLCVRMIYKLLTLPRQRMVQESDLIQPGMPWGNPGVQS